MDKQLRFNILTDLVGSEKIDQFKGKLSSLSDNMVKAASGAFLFDKALQVGRAGLDKFLEVAELGDKLLDISEKTGIAADKISQFQGAASQSNLSNENLEKSLKKLSSTLGDLGNSKTASVFKSLGISIKDTNGQIKDASDILLQVSDKFQMMQDGPTKAAIAVDLFGKSGTEMIPMLNLGAEGIEKFAIRMGSDFPAQSKRFNDALDATKKILLEQQISIAQDYIPALSDVIEAWNKLNEAQSNNNYAEGVRSEIKAIASASYYVFKYMSDGFDSLFTKLRQEFTFLKTLIMETVNTAKSLATLDFKNIGKEWNKGDSEIKNLQKGYLDRSQNRLNDVANFNEALLNTGSNDGAKDKPKSSFNYNSQSDSESKKQLEAIEKFKFAQQEQINLEKSKLEHYKMTSDEIEKSTIAMQIRSQVEKDSVGWSETNKAKLREVSEEYIKQRQAVVDLQTAQKSSFGVGAQTALKTYVESLKDVAKQTEQMFTRGFSNMEDSLVSFVKTGQLNFKQFADAIIDDLLRIAVKQAMLGMLTGLGFAGGSAAASATPATSTATPNAFFAQGGVMSGLGRVPLKTYSTGGIANTPQMAIFGEGSSPEAYVPLPDGKSIPVNMKGQQSGNIVVQVHVNVESGETQVTGTSGTVLAESIAAAVKNQLLIEKRPGGLLAGGR